VTPSKWFGLGIVLAFIAIIAVLAVVHTEAVFKLPVVVTLGYFFIGVVAIFAAYISAKAYLKSGSPVVLVLGSGALAFGLSGLLCGLAVGLVGSGNLSGTLFNTGLLLAGALHVQSGVLSAVGPPSADFPKRGRMSVTLAYLGVLVFMAILTVAALQDATPPFFVPGMGPTVLFYWVLGITVALYVISSLSFMRIYFDSRTHIVYWYSLSLALVALGTCSLLLMGGATDVPVHWVGRLAYYLGAAYLLISVLTTRGARASGTQP
jgi:hypothetical protein